MRVVNSKVVSMHF